MITVYKLEQSEQWDSIVRSFINYDVYYLSGYAKAFQIHGDGEPLLFYYSDQSTVGINVVMKRDVARDKRFVEKIKENTYFDFSTPYGYGGWLIEGENKAQLYIEYEAWCQKNGIISEFVRFHPMLGNHEFASNSYRVIQRGAVVAIDLTSPEIIWANINSKNRNVIRKAQKNDVRIYNGRYPEIYQVFKEMYNSTMDKDHAEEYYYFGDAFYQSILNDLPQSAQVFYAVLNGNVIAASIMLATNKKMNYHLSGSVKEYAGLAPTNLLLYEAALWGYNNGCKTLYLGGGVGNGKDSLYKFKKSFYRGDDLSNFYIGTKIMNREIYDELVSMRNDVLENDYFPKYRA